MNKERYKTIIILLVAIIIGLAFYVLLFGKIKVSSVSIINKGINIFVGDSKSLEVSIIPEDASDKTLLWESNNPDIALVSDTGIITGVNPGDAIITVKSKDNDVSDSCMVRVVSKEAETLELNESDIEIRINESMELGVVVTPYELSNLITWVSDDESIAVVDKGRVSGIASGKTIIRAIYGNKEAVSNVKVVLPVTSLNIEKESLKININDTSIIKTTIMPEEASNQELNWESSNPSIATVDNGTVKGISEGTTIITASIDGKKVTCEVKVMIPADSIKLNKTKINLKKGASETLSATISPSYVTDNTITWTSSDEKIVKVDNNGKVTGMKTGKATITAEINGKKATCEVTSIGYAITENNKFSSIKTVTLYNSETFKYVIKKDGGNFVLVWVMDANKQLNSALPKLGTAYSADTLLSKEISSYGYQNKGLVATNASYFWDGWGDSPGLPFIINKGKIIRDIQNINYNRTIYGTLGVTKDGNLKTYSFSKNDYAKNQASKQELLNDGVRNVFAYTLVLIKPDGTYGVKPGNDKNDRTILCQVDENNFVIYSGDTLNFIDILKKLKTTYECKVAYNLDGGGSRKLYYKTGSMSSPKKLYGGSRNIPDMLYFVEQ